jgi:hypothetical protein
MPLKLYRLKAVVFTLGLENKSRMDIKRRKGNRTGK